ncbi:tyrosine-type recombinase/integrase [Rhodococcus opacus]|uniref:tyrosine-type recombinase/integrase n=1 Tax=Rhodococcus opacus TaxID=37919 RepID=UPI002955C7A2|nr:site-specific integrase [Rhodococcus opacus]MDV7090640.1 site-specific integrase [Rhodococcus opacus]
MTKRRSKGDGGLYQRGDGLWIGSVDLPPDASGVRGRKTVSSRDKLTAGAKLRDLIRDVEDGLIAPAADKETVANWLQVWLDTIAAPRLRPRTLQTYRSTVKCNIVPHIGSVKLAKLTPANVLSMHQKVVKAGRSSRTAEIAHNTLSKALDDARKHGKVRRNVCELVDSPMVSSKKRGTHTTKQARQVLRVARENGDRMVTRYAAAYLTGARQGEMLGLQWDRVDFERGTLHLEWQLQRLKLKKGADPDDPKRFAVQAGFKHIPLHRGMALCDPKTDESRRLIPLPEPLALLLMEYKEKQPPNPWNLVWVSARGTPISSRDDTDAWHAALAAAKVPDLVMHAARNTTASLLLEAKVDAHVIASIMGHSSIVTTRGYQYVNPALAREALSNLDGLLSASE